MIRQEQLQVGNVVQGREIVAVLHTATTSTILVKDGEGRFAVEDWHNDNDEASNGWYAMSFAAAQRRYVMQIEYHVYYRKVLIG